VAVIDRSMSSPATADRPAYGWLGLLASSVSAGSLNLAASVLDRPRAFEAPAALLLPLGLGVGVFALAYGLSFLVLLPLRLNPAVRAAALGVGWIAVGALGPLAEVVLRGLNPYHRPAVWTLLVVACLGLAVCAGLLAARSALAAAPPRPGERRGPGIALFPAFAAVGLLALVWFLEYRSVAVLAVPLAAGLGVLAWVALAWLRRAYGSLTPLASLFAWIGIAAGVAASWGDRASDPLEGRVDGPSPVVLITVDTLRSDHVSYLDGDAPATPTFDRLLADSFVFEQARSAAPWTKPSLASLLTGLSPMVHGTTNRRARLPQGIRTLAERFQEAGYATGGVGLNVHLEHAFRFGQGFADYRFPALPEYGISVGSKVLEALRPNRFPELFPSTTAITDVAVDWVRTHRDVPFFLWVHSLDPHWRYEPPAQDVPEEWRGGELFWGDHGTVTAVQAGNLKLGPADRDYVRMLYEGEIRYTDRELGRLIRELKELGLYDRALIAFASDHGEEFWEHGRFEHGHTLYDEVLRVPLAFKLPENASVGRSDVAVSTESLTPTLVELAGLEASPSEFSSPSLRPLVASSEGPTEHVLAPSFANGTYYHGEKEMVLFGGGRWKYVADLETGREVLFDLVSDPGEELDLSAVHPDRITAARDLLKRHYEQSADLRKSLEIDAEDTTLDQRTNQRLRDLGYSG